MRIPSMVLLIAMSWSAPAAAELAAVWAVDDGTKVKATDLSHALKAKNGIYSSAAIKIFGARNETVAFQLVLQGGSAKTSGVTVTLPSVGTIKNSGVSNNPDTYFKGRNIELFKEEYLNVTTRSHGLVWETGDAPKGWSGWIPDPLVPLNLMKDFSVTAKRNQAVWVDVYIPKGTPPGVHKGVVTVMVNGKACGLSTCKLPLELTVVNATIPDKVRSKTMIWFSGDDEDSVLGRYFSDPYSITSKQRKEIKDRHFKLGRRHMLTLFIGKDSAPNNEILGRVKGTIYSSAAGYHGWGVGQGQDMYSIHTYGGKLNASQAATWTNWFKANAPGVEYFLYVWDEPGSSKYSEINTIAGNAKPVPSFVTTGYTTSLGKVDIFCALAEYYSMKTAAKGKAAGKKIWVYNGMRPFSGSFAIDDVAVSPRVNPWIQYKYDIPRWFFWEATYYRDFQGGAGDINVFTTPLNFSNGSDEVNGDGLLIYPGQDKIYPGQDRGFAGPLPSIRMKNWRRGIQDVEYLVMAKASGHKKEHDAAMAMVVTKALYDETKYLKPIAWSDSGETLLEARRKLAMLFKSTTPVTPDGPKPPKDTGPNPPKDTGPKPPGDSGPPTETGLVGALTLEGGCGGCCHASPASAGASGLGLLLLLVIGVLRYRKRGH